MEIYIGADHRGFKLKSKIIEWLKGRDVVDLGAKEYDKYDDYTVFAERVASMVADDRESLGILMCGSGVGVDVVANKFDNVRASIGKNVDQVKAGRTDDDMNILVIAADFTKEGEAKEMINAFLNTKFSRLKRHKKRLEDIKRIEANN